MIKVFLWYVEHIMKRLKFGEWANREDIATQLGESKINDEFPKLVFRYITVSTHIPEFILFRLGWETTIGLFMLSQSLHTPKKIPILSQGDSDHKKSGWEYSGRGSVYWYHMLASAYGWSIEYIKNLSIDTALSLLQEIVVDSQLEKEFYWGLSEIAYPYNPNTEKCEFKPMPRPSFMAEPAPEIKTVRIRKDFMPVGVMVDTSGMVGNNEIISQAT